MKEEIYRKVYIKDPSDLPKEKGFYFIFYKPLPKGSCPMELEYFDTSEERRDYWLNKIESYLQPEQPIEQSESNYDPMCYHDCPECHGRCNCNTAMCSHCESERKTAEDLPESIKELANDYSNSDEYSGCRQASYFGFLRGAMAMEEYRQYQPTDEEMPSDKDIREWAENQFVDVNSAVIGAKALRDGKIKPQNKKI